MNTGAKTPSVLGLPKSHRPWADRAFKWLTLLMALSVFVLIILIGYELAHGSRLTLAKFGWRFLVGSDWDPVNARFGALPFIFVTLDVSDIELVIAVLLSVARSRTR